MSQSSERTILGVSIGHGAHDTWFGVAPVLLAALSAQMRLSNAEIGLVMLLYQSLSAVMQPFFGRLSERIGGRPLAVGSILWTTLMFSGALFAESKILLAVLITLAGIGSAAYHPQGTANATLSGGERWGATAAATFFLGGTLGSALFGAALGGFLLSTFGKHSLLILSLITITLALTVVRRMVPRWMPVQPKQAQVAQIKNGSAARIFWILLAFLLGAIALRALAHFTLNNYIPKYQQDLGMSPAQYGLLMSLLLFGEAFGGVGGSYLADRVGIRRVLVGSLGLAAVFLWLFMQAQGLTIYALFALSGFFIGPSHTLMVVAGQRQFPQRMAMVSGFFLGFTFISGAGGAWVMGLIADQVGLARVLGVLPVVLVIAALCAFIGVPRTPTRK
jgi:MFS transporter, FSR family, fosmidomycin resistance protein